VEEHSPKLSLIESVDYQGSRISPAMSRFDLYSDSQLSKVSEELDAMASRNSVSRFIHYDDDVQTINGHIQTITWSIQNFTVLHFTFV
jgi:hypothetical protein